MTRRRSPWQKVLYKDQGVPDNYYDRGEFLKGLQTNVNVVHYSFYEAVWGATFLVSQINVVVLYLAFFELVEHDMVSFNVLLLVTTIVVLCCAGLYATLNWKHLLKREDLLDGCRSCITLGCLGYGFTPVIRTLTTSVSTDSIYTMAFALFLFSLVFHDYGMDAPIVSSAFSLNLALAASICLISRLHTDPTAFCFLFLTICGFSIWPSLRNQGAARFPRWFPWTFTLILIPLSTFSVLLLSKPLAIFNTIIQLFVLIACPLLLVQMQHLKSTIHGPWDEATLYVNKNE